MTYKGSCHCGAVSYEVEGEIEGVIQCNCSICSKTGTLLAFAGASQFELRSGEDHLTDYQFAAMKIHHVFCDRCGIRSFARGTGPQGPMVAINVRCLEGVDLDALTRKAFDGRSL